MAKRKAEVTPKPQAEEVGLVVEVVATVEEDPGKRPWVDECPHCHAGRGSLFDWPPGRRPGRGRVCCRKCGTEVVTSTLVGD